MMVWIGSHSELVTVVCLLGLLFVSCVTGERGSGHHARPHHAGPHHASNLTLNQGRQHQHGHWEEIKSKFHASHLHLKEVAQFFSPLGVLMKRYKESVGDLEVYDSFVDFQVNADGHSVKVIASWVLEDAEEDLKGTENCSLTATDVDAAIRKHENFGEETHLHFLSWEPVVYGEPGGIAHNATLVEVVPEEAGTNRTIDAKYIIDVCSHEVLRTNKKSVDIQVGDGSRSFNAIAEKSKNLRKRNVERAPKPCAGNNSIIATGGNPRLGPMYYGIEPYCINMTKTDDENDTCILSDQFRTGVDMEHSSTRRFDNIPFRYPCGDYKETWVNGAPSALLDAYFYATSAGRMLEEWYHLNISKLPHLYVLAHYGKQLVNAFQISQHVLFGDGGEGMFPLSTAVDAVGHEFGHFVMSYTSKVEYKGEAGGICESFADMFGETLKTFVNGEPSWLLYSDVIRSRVPAIRYFKTPSQDGCSIEHLSEMSSNVSVHCGSGIFNKAFYLISQSLGIKRTFETFLLANNLYWHPTTDFENAACSVIQSAYDSGYDMDVFRKVFQSLGFELKQCKQPRKLITVNLKPGTKLVNVMVSQVRQPLYKIWIPRNRSIKLKIMSKKTVSIQLRSSYNAESIPLLTGSNSLVISERKRRGPYYVTLICHEEEDHEVTLETMFVYTMDRNVTAHCMSRNQLKGVFLPDL